MGSTFNTYPVVKRPIFHHPTRCWWLLPTRGGEIGWLGGPVNAAVEVKVVYTVCGEAESEGGIGKEKGSGVRNLLTVINMIGTGFTQRRQGCLGKSFVDHGSL